MLVITLNISTSSKLIFIPETSTHACDLRFKLSFETPIFNFGEYENNFNKIKKAIDFVKQFLIFKTSETLPTM